MITVIGAEGCRPCERLKAALDREGIRYDYMDESDPRALSILRFYEIEDGPFPAVIKDGMLLPPMTREQYIRSLR